jgi:hypothetical protein
MIDELIKQHAEQNAAEKEEELLIERLETRAEGVGAIQYGDDTSHGGGDGDRMAVRTIRLAEVRDKIAPRKVERTALRADTISFFFERADSLTAYIMMLYVVDGMTFRQIADKIGRSHEYVRRTVISIKKILDS